MGIEQKFCYTQMMNDSLNLFVSLHHWASRQDENFTTESFAYILKYLQNFEESIFLKLLSKLSDGLINSNNDKVNQIEISTQQRLENTIQDIQIKTPEKLIFIEIKFSSDLTSKQVTAYLELLKKRNYKPENTKLVCLTRSPISNEITQGAFPLRWYQVAEWLEEEINSTDKEISRFLIKSFLEFLVFQKSTLSKVSSAISQGLVNYQNTVGEKSILNKRFRNLDKIAEINELKPLYDLMLLIFEALKEIVSEKVIKFDTGNNKSGNGFVAYNINKIEYFVWIEYRQPEKIKIETFNRIVEKHDGGLEYGIVSYNSKYKRNSWQNIINLVDEGFFDLDKQSQLNFLTKILRKNLSFAEKISKPWIK